MNAIRIRKTIDSDTLTIPELKGMIGRTVEIIVLEEPVTPGVVRGNGDWDAVLAAVQHLDDYDYQAQVDQDACDIRNSEGVRVEPRWIADYVPEPHDIPDEE